MEINELYLKTAFCCMACDGDIAQEEVELIKDYVANSELFSCLDVEDKLNEYIAEVNQSGVLFLNSYLKDMGRLVMTQEQELKIVEIAIQIIEADNKVEYSEVSFFKKIRLNLNLSDEDILREFPDKEDYLLPDIIQKDCEFTLNVKFSIINLIE